MFGHEAVTKLRRQSCHIRTRRIWRCVVSQLTAGTANSLCRGGSWCLTCPSIKKKRSSRRPLLI